MGVLKLEMEMEPGRPAAKYVTYYVKPPPGRSMIFTPPASVEILVNSLNIPGTESSMRAHKRNKELLPKNIRVTIEWDEAPGEGTNSSESLGE